MNYLSSRCAQAALAAVVCGLLAIPVLAEAESIESFDAQYLINPTGTVSVIETLRYDFGSLDRHGIFRTLSLDHPQPAEDWLRERYVEITVRSVSRAGEPAPYQLTRGGDELEIKIGDPDRTISGVHEYEISYTLEGALLYGSKGTELYWNVTGDEWDVPIHETRVVVVGVGDVALTQQRACYAGGAGSRDSCTLASSTTQGAFFAADRLAPGEQLTIGQAIEPRTVATQTRERWQLGWLAIAYPLLVLPGLIWFVIRRRRAHDPGRTVIAQYEPYRELLPMYTGALFDGRLDPHDISSGIVYLAEQGFLRIERTERSFLAFFTTSDYTLTLKRPISEAPNEASRDVLILLFSTQTGGLSVTQITRFLAERDLSIVTDGLAAVGTTVTLSELSRRKQRNARLVQALQKRFKKQLQEQGYFEQTTAAVPWLAFLSALVGAALVMFLAGNLAPMVVTAVGVAILTIVAFSPRRTAAGYEAYNHLRGFKDFLSVTDKERFTFHNAPEKSPELFMEYLPYAIALKVEKEWAQVFDDITIPAPSWYADASGTHSFSAAAFTSDLSTFSSSFSSSSGASGSSGGGSAGGGGGGGGGGSW